VHGPSGLVGHRDWPRFKALAIARTGLGYYADKDELLADRLADRLACHASLDLTGYLALLEGEPLDGIEAEALVAAITIGETSFFRDAEQLEALIRYAVPDRAAQHRADRHLEVWSAGCANGAEVYSVAMMLRSHPLVGNWQLRVLGTDIDRTALAEAVIGEYGAWSLRGMRVEANFTAAGPRWRVTDVFRRGVEFRHHNLVTDPPPVAGGGSGFDIVLCRNVLMYFAPPQRRVALAGIRRSMAEGGWLAVGCAEVCPEMDDMFTPVRLPHATLYRKTGKFLAEGPLPDGDVGFHMGIAFDHLDDARAAMATLRGLLSTKGDS
jgi:chemotaxis protein methyltransferase CheR